MRTLLSPDSTTPQKLLTALNAAASLLQNARESEEEIFIAFNDQIQELGLRGGIALVDPQKEKLVFQSVAQPGRKKVLKTLERLIGVNSNGFAVPIDQVEVYHQVLTTGEAVYVSNTRKILTQVLPVSDQSLIARAVEAFGGDPAIYCPLIVRDEIIGLINVAGKDLTENDLSVMKAFANYLSTALSNTRLIEELKEKESVYRSFFSNLPIGIYRISKSGQFLMGNPVFLNQFGVEDFSQLEGHTMGDKYLKPMHDRAAVIQKLEEEGEIIGLETEWEDVHGERKFFKENIKGIFSPDDELLYYEGSFENISEKMRTEKTIQKQLDDLKLLNRIAASGAKATSTDDLLEEVTGIISENLFPKHMGALLWDESLGKLVVHPSYRGLPPKDYEKQFAPGEGITGTVYQTGKAARIGDTRDFPGYIPSKPGLRSELCVPIKAGDTILGVLNAEREEVDGFSQEEEILLTTIADQLATALEKAEFFEEVENQALQLSLLNEATLTTSRILEPRELINLIAKQIIDLFNPDSFLISLYNEPAKELEVALAVEKGQTNEATTGMKTPLSQGGLTSLVLETGSLLKIDDLENSPLLVGFKHLEPEMRGSWLGIPLVSGNHVVGARTIQYYSKKLIDKEQTQFLESLASHAAIAITNGKLFNDIHRRFELSNKLAVLSEEFSRPQTLSEVIEKIGKSALSLLNLEMGALYLRTGDSQAVCSWSEGLSDDYLNSVTKHIADLPGGSLLQNSEPILIPDVMNLSEDQLLRQLAEKEGLRSISLWPLVYEEKTIAAVGGYGREPNGWAEEETDAMMTFARQAALSIQNARLLESERNRRMEAEALYKTTTALTSTLDMNKVLDNILVELYRVVDYASASLQLLVDDMVRITAVQGFQIDPDTLIGLEFPASNRLFQEMLNTRQPIILENAQADNRFDYFTNLDYIRGWIGVPLIVGEKVIGCLTIDSEHVGFFDDSHAKKAQAFANQAAIAIESARLFSQTQRRLNELQSIHTIDQAISGNLDINITLDVFLEQALNLLQVDGIRVFSYDPDAQIFERIAHRNMLTVNSARDDHFYIKQTVQDAVAQRDVIVCHDPPRRKGFSQEEFSCYTVSPLISRGQVRGVVELFNRHAASHNEEWISLLRTLTTQAAIAIENDNLLTSLKQSNDELVTAYDRTLEGWAYALELRDRETVGHARRVTELTLKLAKRMGIGGADLASIRRGTLLHDIGKMGLPDSILLKEGPLTDEEREVMQTHPLLAYDMLSTIPYLKSAIDIPLYHHEKWDGSGYPHGLSAEAIPLAARIFAVVDVWDALISDRPYRRAWKEETAREYIKDQSSIHFDPAVVEEFLKIIKS